MKQKTKGGSRNNISDWFMIEKLVIEKEVTEVKDRIMDDRSPVFLWGMGAHARQVVRFCRTYGIELKGVFTDTDSDIAEWMNLPVLQLSDIKSNNPDFSVIVGHSTYYKADAFKKKHHIRNIYSITNVAYGKFERILPKFIERHDEEYTQTYNWLCDAESRINMAAYLNARINDDASYTVERYRKDMTYFRNDIFELGGNETYIDAGAFDGDTIREFLRSCKGEYSRILGLEADRNNFTKLKAFVDQNSLKQVTVTDTGAWNCKTHLYFDDGDEQGSAINLKENTSGHVIDADTIDNLCKTYGISDVSLIKFNYCQGLTEAIQGCTGIIQNSKPRFAIRAGFDEWALIQIPQLLKQINPQYRFYLRYCLPVPAGLTLFAL